MSPEDNRVGRGRDTVDSKVTAERGIVVFSWVRIGEEKTAPQFFRLQYVPKKTAFCVFSIPARAWYQLRTGTSFLGSGLDKLSSLRPAQY